MKRMLIFIFLFLSFINRVNASLGTVVCSNGNTSPLNVRDNINGNVIGSLGCNSNVEILNENAGSSDNCAVWYQVKQGDTTGYSCSQYISINRGTSINRGKVSCVGNDSPLNVWNGTDRVSRVTTLSCDTELKVLDSNVGSTGACSNWYKIEYDGGTGYACGT